jgi:hypothetical protein
MVVNRKTRSKPAAGAARTAGQALQKSTSVAKLAETDQSVEPTETEVDAVEPVADATVVEPIVEPVTIAVAEPTIEPELNEPELRPLAVLDVKPKAAPIVLEAEVLPTESVVTDPVVAKATPAKTNPKATQKPKGASAMTEAETPKTSAIAKADAGVVGMIYSAGERPIGASAMNVFGTILNGRPIEASSVKLFDILPGDRPVFADAITYVAGGAPGGRPVMVSPAGMLNAGVIMGYRPIFSNDDASDPNGEQLMGYLD